MRVKVNLDTMDQINRFVKICSTIPDEVQLTSEYIDDSTKKICYCYRVSAKSLLGAVASMEWSEVYVCCDTDIYSKIKEFIVE